MMARSPGDDRSTVGVTVSDTTLRPDQIGHLVNIGLDAAGGGPTTNGPATVDGVAGRRITMTHTDPRSGNLHPADR